MTIKFDVYVSRHLLRETSTPTNKVKYVFSINARADNNNQHNYNDNNRYLFNGL